MTSQTEFLEAFELIKNSYNVVMEQIDSAVDYVSKDDLEKATEVYGNCLKQIEATFLIPIGIPDDVDKVQAEWNFTCKIIQKLKVIKAEILYRVKVLHSKINENVDRCIEMEMNESTCLNKTNNADHFSSETNSNSLVTPHTYFDIHNDIGASRTYNEYISGLRKIVGSKSSSVKFDTLFESNAKLYQIQSNGIVSTICGDISMSVAMCTVDGDSLFLNGLCFIQCTLQPSSPNRTIEERSTSTYKPNEEFVPPSSSNSTSEEPSTFSNKQNDDFVWLYPLLPGITTCYQTDYGAFIFPDMESMIPGSAFGILLCRPLSDDGELTEMEDQLTHTEIFFLDLLQALLAGTVKKLENRELPGLYSDSSTRISRNIIGAADFFASNIIKGAEKTGQFLERNTPYIISKIRPAPPDAPPVNSKVQSTVEVAKNVTHAAAGVTEWVASKVGSTSVAIGRFLAPHIQTKGSYILEKGFGYTYDEANTKMEGAFTIAASAVEGFTTVYAGLETSAKILGTNLSENSVKIIEHKYGPSAGNVAAGTFDTFGNAFNVSRNVNYMTPRGIAKKMAKNTGKALLAECNNSITNGPNYIEAGSIYPNLLALKTQNKDPSK